MADELNIVLAVIGGARADRLSCHGYGRETTPFLDEVARQGVRFSAAFSTAPKALSAHAALFSGLHASTHAATEEAPHLGEGVPVLAEVLRDGGYRTAAFCPSPSVQPATGFGRGFDHFRTPRGDGRSIARAAYYARRASDRLLRRSDAGARRGNAALFDWLSASDQRFFAFLHYGEARLRLQPPLSHERLFLPAEIKRGQLRAVEREWVRGRGAHEEEAPARREILDGVYDGALRYVDERLAEVAAHLERRGLWDRTLFVVVGDHGEDLGEHDLPLPGFALYDTLLHVPLLVRCPPRIPRGFVVEEIAQHVDLLPTILHFAGIEPPASGHGRPLLRDGGATAGPGFAIAECFRPDLGGARKRMTPAEQRRLDVRQRAIRTRREKFIWRSDEDNEFYDLGRDPGEHHNLVASERARAARLRAGLFTWLASVDRGGAEPAALDEAQQRRA